MLSVRLSITSKLLVVNFGGSQKVCADIFKVYAEFAQGLALLTPTLFEGQWECPQVTHQSTSVCRGSTQQARSCPRLLAPGLAGSLNPGFLGSQIFLPGFQTKSPFQTQTRDPKTTIPCPAGFHSTCSQTSPNSPCLTARLNFMNDALSPRLPSL